MNENRITADVIYDDFRNALSQKVWSRRRGTLMTWRVEEGIDWLTLRELYETSDMGLSEIRPGVWSFFGSIVEYTVSDDQPSRYI